MEQINVYDALKIMRKLSAENFPFTFSFIGCDRSKGTSQGLVTLNNAVLSKGLPASKSKHHMNLVAYQNMDTGEYRQFWVPLLMTFNNIKISHDRISRR